MAHIFIEVEKESRPIDVTNTSIKQDFVFKLCLDKTLLDSAFPGSEVFGASDDVVALQFAYSIVPIVRVLPDYFGNPRLLVINNLKVEHTGPNEWRVMASYTYDLNRGTGNQAPGDNSLPYIKIGFTIGGGTKNIKQSLSVLEYTQRSDFVGPPPPLQLGTAIGVSDDGIEGAEVPDASFNLQITGYFLPSFVTLAYALTLRNLIKGSKNTGTYNSTPYLGANVGEVQLRSASGGGTVVDIIPITFDFYINTNVVDQEDPGFPNLNMLGWDFLDYRFEHVYEENNSKKMIVVPSYRIIHRIHTPADYRLTGLPIEQ